MISWTGAASPKPSQSLRLLQSRGTSFHEGFPGRVQLDIGQEAQPPGKSQLPYSKVFPMGPAHGPSASSKGSEL